jgi:uncharacterized membrane protein
METSGSPVDGPPMPSASTQREMKTLYAFFGAIRTRIVGGLILGLPIAITFWIVLQLYLTLQNVVLAPTIYVIHRIVGEERVQALPAWWRDIVQPVFALGCVLALLYFLGLFVSTRLARTIDWLMSRVPVVTTIYQAVRGVFESLGNQKGTSKFKRVVSVAYPHAGTRVPGFVMKSMNDVQTGRTILSVFVPFAPLPTSGFVLLVPEDDVIDLGWTVNETMQGIVSGGLSLPNSVRFTAAGASAQGLAGGTGTILN